MSKRDVEVEPAQPDSIYEPPCIEESAEFESLALACGFSDGTSDGCLPGAGLQSAS